MNRQERRQAVRVRDVKRAGAAVRHGGGAPVNPVTKAYAGACKLAAAEIVRLVAPAREAVDAMRRGLGTLEHWQQLASAVNISKAIERQGIVRGLLEHLTTAENTLATIHRRASEELRLDPEARHAYALHLAEIEALALAIELLFDYQLKQLSRSELRAAMAYAEAEVRSSGGVVIERRPRQEQASLPLTNGSAT